MKQVKLNETRPTRADMIAYLAERDRQRLLGTSETATTRKTRKTAAQLMAFCSGV